jgi:hypothetical protein
LHGKDEVEHDTSAFEDGAIGDHCRRHGVVSADADTQEYSEAVGGSASHCGAACKTYTVIQVKTAFGPMLSGAAMIMTVATIATMSSLPSLQHISGSRHP